MKKKVLILAIDTSCDETSVAITENLRVLSNIISSQVELHKKWGGVVPSLAKRAHQENLKPVLEESFFQAKKKMKDIDFVAVTYGPGLAVALEVGINFAKKIALAHRKSLIAVDHMEAHLLSAFAQDMSGNFGIKKPKFPALGLLVSGGHTELVLMEDFGKYKLLGQTLDDAVGECFDKVAKMLNLDYPGGPIISRFANFGKPDSFRLPIPMKNSGDLNFSYSGLKTACKNLIANTRFKTEIEISNFCASFERAIIESLIIKLIKAVEGYKPKMILLGGGVISSQKISQRIKTEMDKYNIPVYIPYSKNLLTDNAAMVGIAGYFKALKKDFVKKPELLDRVPDLEIGEKMYI